MKQLGFFSFLIVFLFSCSRENPVEYNDAIITPQIEMVAYLDSMVNESDSWEEISAHRKNLLNYATEGREKTETLGAFKENNSYRKAAIDYYAYSLELFDEPDLDSLFLKLNQTYPLNSEDSSKVEEFRNRLQKYIETEEVLLREQSQFLKRFKIAPNR